MSSVGIIANPASGKDIRRLVARSSVFDNNEKVAILRRLLIGLDAIGVEAAYIMPDYYGLGERAADGLTLNMAISLLPMAVQADERDTVEAAGRLADMGVGCLVTLGGDGTNRAAAKTCGQLPLLAISTGTNNVVPAMVEATVAGLAAGLLATGAVDAETVSQTSKRLEVFVDHEFMDIALVDVAVSSDLFVATRAVWDPSRIKEIVLSRAEPGSIGLSSIGSAIHPIALQDDCGLHLVIGEGGTAALAPVAPGLVVPIPLRGTRVIALDTEVELEPCVGMLALDGERCLALYPEQRVAVRLTRHGPRIVDMRACLAEAARGGVFQGPMLAEVCDGYRD